MDSFAIGTVLSVDAENRLIYCSFRSGMQAGIPVRASYDSYCDGMRVRQRPLPMPMTTGLVCFPNDDSRNGVWLWNVYVNQQDAISSDASDPHLDYYAHWSGYWSYLDKNGTMAHQWPDATYFVAGSGNVLPKTYRHIVDGDQKRQRIEYTFSDRVSGQASPFYYSFSHAAGTSFVVDPSGSFSASGGASGHWSLIFGGTRLALDKEGNLSTVVASGATLSTQAGGATIAVDASGNYTLTVPSGKKITFTAGGGAADTLALVSLLVEAFNSHTHGGVQGGTSTTATPTTPWTAATIQSPLFATDT